MGSSPGVWSRGGWQEEGGEVVLRDHHLLHLHPEHSHLLLPVHQRCLGHLWQEKEKKQCPTVLLPRRSDLTELVKTLTSSPPSRIRHPQEKASSWCTGRPPPPPPPALPTPPPAPSPLLDALHQASLCPPVERNRSLQEYSLLIG